MYVATMFIPGLGPAVMAWSVLRARLDVAKARDELGFSPPAVSHTLALLRHGGILARGH